MRFVKNYLKENLKWLLLVLACFGILCFVIGFEQVPLAQWGYAAFFVFLPVFAGSNYRLYKALSAS